MDLNLDSLLGNDFRGATFHDSLIVRLHVDFVTATAELHCLIFIGRSNNMNSYTSGILKFTRLLFFALEPPHSEFLTNKPLWITADGPLPDPQFKSEMKLPTNLPKDTFMHYIYSSSTNSFMVVAAGEASFTWKNIME